MSYESKSSVRSILEPSLTNTTTPKLFSWISFQFFTSLCESKPSFVLVRSLALAWQRSRRLKLWFRVLSMFSTKLHLFSLPFAPSLEPIRAVRETPPQWEHCYFWDKRFRRDLRRASPFNLLSFHEIFSPPNEPIGYLYTKEKSPGNSKIWFVKNLEQHV